MSKIKFPEIPRDTSQELYKYFIQLQLNLKTLLEGISANLSNITNTVAVQNTQLLAARGIVTLDNSVEINSGEYTFSIKKNTNNNYASFYVTRNDGTPTSCVVSWKSSWGSTAQWATQNINPGAIPVVTDNDLGYGSLPSRGGSHVVLFMDNVSYKMWFINSMICGNANDSADWASMTVDCSGAL